MAFFKPEETDQESILEELVPTLQRNKLLLGALFALIVLGVYGALLYQSNKYESTALLLVMLGRENSEAPITAENASIFTDGVQAEEINSYVRLLSSHSLIEETVDRLGVERFTREPEPPKTIIGQLKYRARLVARWFKARVDDILIGMGLRPELSDREKVIKLLKRSLTVARERDSNVINVTLRLTDPKLAQETVDTMVSIYGERHIAARQNDNVRTAFELQTEVYRAQLGQLRDRMQEIREEWNITSAEQQRSSLVAELVRAEFGLQQKRSRLAQLQSEEAALNDLLNKLPGQRKQSEQLDQNPTIKLLNDELARVRIERAEKAKSYDEGSKILELLDAKIADVEALLEAEKEQITQSVIFELNPMVDELSHTANQLRVEAAGVATGIEQDEKIIAELKAQIERLNEGADLLEMAQLEYSVLEERFTSNAARLEQAKIKQALDNQRIANIALIGGPTYSEEPVAPRRLLLMGVGVAAAAVLSVALVLLKEWMGARVYGRRELETIPGVEYLGRFRVHG